MLFGIKWLVLKFWRNELSPSSRLTGFGWGEWLRNWKDGTWQLHRRTGWCFGLANLSYGRRKRRYGTDEIWQFHTYDWPKFSQTFLYNWHTPSPSYVFQHPPELVSVILKTEEAHSSETSERTSTTYTV